MPETKIEQVARAWKAEECMWSGPHWNGAGMSGHWEARRRADPNAAIKFGDGTETVRLKEVDSADATREIADLIRERCAREAIAAMRVPTEAMTYAARHALVERDGNIAGPIFTAMIDAALKEGTDG